MSGNAAPTLPPHVIREHCDRCGNTSRTIDWRSTACLCASCCYELQTMKFVQFTLDVDRWAFRPEKLSRVFEATHAH